MYTIPLERNNEKERIAKFLNIAKDLRDRYIHNEEAWDNMHSSLSYGELKYYNDIVESVEKQKEHCSTNCIASATYMSKIARELGIKCNLMKCRFGSEIHYVLLYECSGELCVCDIQYSSRGKRYANTEEQELYADTLLQCPLESYRKISELMRHGQEMTDSVLYDMSFKRGDATMAMAKLPDQNTMDNAFQMNKAFEDALMKSFSEIFGFHYIADNTDVEWKTINGIFTKAKYNKLEKLKTFEI